MKIVFVTFILIVFAGSHALPQEVVFGKDNYIEYQIGTLPIVISVSHGGKLAPMAIPDRTCNDPVYATDAYTIETALEIKNSLFKATGCYPHLIICHLKRTKLDCNRNITDGACGNVEAETAWAEFHQFIATARQAANEQYDYNTFFIDLHGHGNPIQRIELGYLLYDYELEESDNVLNTGEYVRNSSIGSLAMNNLNGLSHAQLLRGPKAFGTLLANLDYPSVPSQQIPYPGRYTNYFSGGYITVNHTSYATGVKINGLQMELNYSGVRNSAANRSLFADSFSKAIIDYMSTHFDLTWNECNPLSILETQQPPGIPVSPNPIKKGHPFRVLTNGYSHIRYEMFDKAGRNILSGEMMQPGNEISLPECINSGIYVLKIRCTQSGEWASEKIIVE